jgi:GNAT superfamily N-acetyltransferase
MTQIFAFTFLALLLARVMQAPRGTWRWILAAAFAVVTLSQMLPAGNAFREDVRGALPGLGWAGLAALPIAAYGLLIRSLRRRTRGASERASVRPTGLVLVVEDEELATDTARAALAEAGVLPLSIGYRDAQGRMAGHARLLLADETAELSLLRVIPEQRRQGIGTRLLAQAEAEARERGAVSLAATSAAASRGFFVGRGYAEYGKLEGPGGRSHFVKGLK